MKNHKIALLSLLMLSPLLMANSPAPHVEPGDYKAFECKYVSTTKVDNVDSAGKTYYSYNFNIRNLGEGYIESVRVSCESFTGYLYNFSNDFSSNVIAPGKEAIYYYRTTQRYEHIANDTHKYTCKAYQEFVNDAFTTDKKEITVDTYKSDSETYYYYYLSFDSDIDTKNNDYRYGIIADVTYKGENYFTHVEYGEGNKVCLYSGLTEPLEIDELTVNNIKMTRSKRSGSAAGNIFLAIIIILAIFGVLLLSGIIFVVIFFTVLGIKKARRAK